MTTPAAGRGELRRMRALALTGELGTAGLHALWLAVFSAILFPPAINLMHRRLVT